MTFDPHDDDPFVKAVINIPGSEVLTTSEGVRMTVPIPGTRAIVSVVGKNARETAKAVLLVRKMLEGT